MTRAWMALAVLAGTAAAGTAPYYSANSIVNSADYTGGPFAPNSVLSIFGSGLSWSAYALTADDIQGNSLPIQLNNTRVFVDNSPAPLLYVSDGQINFIVPVTAGIGDVKIRVVREGVTGPEVTITLADAAPALFEIAPGSGYAIATHVDNSIITPDSPAHAGELIVVYATGLGKTVPNPAPRELPQYAAPLLWLNDLRVLLNGTAIDPGAIQYAGLTPDSAGLYQINLVLPDSLAPDPEIRVAIGDRTSSPGRILAVR
jgi:uncharacterized protein (TIGR03437 family)